MSLDALSQQAQASLENKNMQNFRAKLKAKAMVATQQPTGGKDSPSQPEKVAKQVYSGRNSDVGIDALSNASKK